MSGLSESGRGTVLVRLRQRRHAALPERLTDTTWFGSSRSVCAAKRMERLWRISFSGCMLAPLVLSRPANAGRASLEGLTMRHKPLLNSYSAGQIGLGLLPIAMAIAAAFIP
jgi:hypothetical protein